MAFHAFLRLGKTTAKSANSKSHILQSSDISFEREKAQLSALQIVVRHFKTNKHHEPLIIYLTANQTMVFCPVNAMWEYLQLSKHTSGPLFQLPDCSPFPYSKVASHLKRAIEFSGLDPNSFKGHSFRIGAATHAASLGYSENLIQK